MQYFAANGVVSTNPIVDGVEITESQYGDGIEAMLAGQQIAIIDGELTTRDPAPSPEHTWANGEWVFPEPAPPLQSELWIILRAKRDRLLAETDKLMLRHADEVALEVTPTLSVQQYQDLLVYRQALRDLPENTADLAKVAWPSLPHV